MSSDETFITAVAFFCGPTLWTGWLIQMSRMRPMGARRTGVGEMAAALALCAVLIFVVLKEGASFDVVDSPHYLFMYVVLGLAWARAAVVLFPYVGLSARDDIFERQNRAAVPAFVGALLGVTLCYAGGNIGDGPGWWVVLFSAGLATGTLLAAWFALTQLTPVADSVVIDRDPAAGMRLGAFLTSLGMILGRGVAGDWHSAEATVIDFVACLPYALIIVIAATLVERLARPTPQRPRAPMFASGLVPALIYFLMAFVAASAMGWPA